MGEGHGQDRDGEADALSHEIQDQGLGSGPGSGREGLDSAETVAASKPLSSPLAGGHRAASLSALLLASAATPGEPRLGPGPRTGGGRAWGLGLGSGGGQSVPGSEPETATRPLFLNRKEEGRGGGKSMDGRFYPCQSLKCYAPRACILEEES
ncbi:hypothetical protein OPV22_029377 [Ensete ventricosum]|uniref:FLZ-type domain-containing protein n=1 Tax=Ensete ventricosum TaxID=4639 RepID=A0AAV8Q5L4_ENSVE|nr:hypothetical protein OPV22_029377 [Ensete ventricosum]